MGALTDIVMVALVALAYGALLLIGGLLWYFGWKRHSESIRKVGDVTVLIGLLADVALIASHWMFDWVTLLRTAIQ